MAIEIPEGRAKRHGGEEFYSSGLTFAETLVQWGGLTADKKILDVGCGPGRMAIGIGETLGWDINYHGLDVIQKDVMVAREHIQLIHPSVKFDHLDVFNGLYNPDGKMQPSEVVFPLDDAAADFTFAASLFTHMFDADVVRYISEMHRTMVAGGTLLTTWFIMDEHIRSSVESGQARFKFAHAHADGTFTDQPDRPEEVIAFQADRVRKIFQDTGFEIVAFHRGAWSRSPIAKGARHSQDCFVCRKA